MLCLPWCHSVQDMSAGEIGSLLRHPAAGDQIAACVQSFPYLQMEAQLHPITHTVLRIQLTITPAFTWKDRWVGGRVVGGWADARPVGGWASLGCTAHATATSGMSLCREPAHESLLPRLPACPLACPALLQCARQRAEVAAVGGGLGQRTHLPQRWVHPGLLPSELAGSLQRSLVASKPSVCLCAALLVYLLLTDLSTCRTLDHLLPALPSPRPALLPPHPLPPQRPGC